MRVKLNKVLVVILFLGISLLLIINYRVPFFQQNAGGWSVGYGESYGYPKTIDVKGNAIYSIEKLKIRNDSTVFLADPFFLKEKDTFYLFFEHY